MVKYDFKKITKVPSGKSLVDIVLSETTRTTPNEIHQQFAIGRIRKFYMTKVKKLSVSIMDRLQRIINEFPRVEDVHPFYGDMINVLYDKDHYKLALGEVNKCQTLVKKIGRDYIQFLRFGESLYKCKKLKVAAFGRMANLIRRLKGLAYLEKVRQHLSRCPQIDPSGRTIMLTGFPNVGKSSFINKITKAKVAVEKYAFTTQSLFVGHFQYRQLQWQVIDSPGILDHPLSARNTIEMQSINALAHLFSTILFLVDISEQSFSIEEQIKLFNNLKPLFRKKPVIIVGTKSDKKKFSELSKEKQQMLTTIKTVGDNLCPFKEVSNITGDGILDVRNMAADLLLKERNVYKLAKGSKDSVISDNILRRLYVSYPEKRDNKERKSFVPDSFSLLSEEERKEKNKKKELAIDKERKQGFGYYQMDMRKQYLLKNDQWKYDSIPEIMDGKNIMDFYDPKIESKVDNLIQEQEMMEGEFEDIDFESKEFKVDPDIKDLFDEIEDKKNKSRAVNKLRSSNHAHLPRKYQKKSLSDLKEGLLDRGVEFQTLKNVGTQAELRGRSKSRNRSNSISQKAGGNSRVGIDNRSISQLRNMENLQKVSGRRENSLLGKRNRKIGFGGHDGGGNRYTSHSLTRGKFKGITDPRKQIEAVTIGFKKRKMMNQRRFTKNFEKDKTVYDFKPKHLFEGTAGFGRDRR